MRQSKTKSLAQKKADKYFSLFIRLRDADTNGMCRCVTCGVFKFWKETDCGHWRRRGLEPTRYDERNCGCQCTKCNYHRSGEPEAFEEHLKRKYGEGAMEKVRIKSLMRSNRSQADYERIALNYKQKSEQLRKQKGL